LFHALIIGLENRFKLDSLTCSRNEYTYIELTKECRPRDKEKTVSKEKTWKGRT